ncbi:hypothetical protein [Falsiroseomonas tokyonensis]|uniref:Lipoprotein n=1 Tax=Falsiroseomonas tokyonensis TaxID=430521 RepID=A0ABV7BYM6_9PROT|nr:hypothetical protein [Falsiroseomonas tokyonensis]MBU8540095.1 hypothetical protein [Falsiroseomonas tokyonensis]
MRRLRALFLLLPALVFAPGCVVAADVTPVGGYGYGYGYAQPYYAPPPPRYYAPRPVYRPYYAPPPRYYGPPRHHGGWDRGRHHGHYRGGRGHWR